MKIQSIFIFCFIFNIGYMETEPRPLTKEENLERLNTCGGAYNYENLLNDDRISFAKNGDIWATANLISKRHVLTSSHLVLHGNISWRHNNTNFGEEMFNDVGNSRIPVPDAALRELKFKWTDFLCTDGCFTKELDAINAFIICDSETRKTGHWLSLPMVVELESNYTTSWPCLADENTNEKSSEPFVFYKYIHKLGHFEGDRLALKLLSTQYYYTDPYTIFDGKGGPLLKVINGKLIIHAIGAYGNGDSEAVSWFHRIRWIQTDLCDLAGICPEQPVTGEHTEPSTTVEDTTEQPTTVPSTTVILELETTVPSEDATTSESPTSPAESSESSECLESTTSESNGSSEPSESSESSESSNSTSESPTASSRPHATFTPPPSTEDAEESEKPEEFHWKHSDIDEEFGDFLDRNEGWNDESEENNDIFLSDDFLVNSGNLDSMGMELFVLGFFVLMKI